MELEKKITYDIRKEGEEGRGERWQIGGYPQREALCLPLLRWAG